MKVCSEPGCPNIQTEGRCLEHRREHEKARGSRQARGYGAEHQRLRARIQSYLDAGVPYRCWRCTKPIDPANWTLGHCDDDRDIYHGTECPSCDYATTGRRDQSCPHPTHHPNTSPDA